METKEILDERATAYGRYKMVSHISQSIKKTIHESPNYQYMPVYMKESLEMIANKLARILNGDYYHIDSWRDISGYSTLAVIEIEDEAKPDELND